MKIRPISLTQFNKEYGNDPVAPFYVLNRSNPNGNIAFNCINELNVTIPVVVLATFIPIDLTTMAPLENLLRSSVLRQILAKGQLVIVRKDEAEEYLSTSRARAEYQRINNINNVESLSSETSAQEEIDMDTGDSSTKKKKKKKVSAHDDFITAMIDRANDNDEDDDALQREFLTRQHVLSLEDLERLRKEVKRPALTEMILEALQEKMNDEEEEEEEDDE